MKIQTFEYKLYPTKNQEETFNQWLEIAHEVWNTGLGRIKSWCTSRFGAKPSYSSLCKDLKEDKKTHDFLKQCNAQVLQQVLKRLSTAFQAYLKKKEVYHGLRSQEEFVHLFFLK
jgi:putative transposase